MKQRKVSVYLDIVFIVDATGSMGSYIDQAKQLLVKTISNIDEISSIFNIKYSLIVYRDHPPQDSSFASKIISNTVSTIELQQGLKSGYFKAAGGGDYPESGLDAINDMCSLDFRENSIRHAFIIGDAPFHGTPYNSAVKDKKCKCGLSHIDVKLIKEKLNTSLTAICLNNKAETLESFRSITNDVVSCNSSSVNTEISQKLEYISSNIIWAYENVLPILCSDKYKPIVDIASELSVTPKKINTSIEVLNVVGLTQKF